ncbi:MAG TPA: type VI secretion system tip protein TssI/VgrG [Pyrinomonadaceae bacterium]|nr:type VI secretion system tip protein TssI/VgrG [Pyrinomonadaceae bacterium]
MATTQDNRLLKIATPLGKDYLMLNSFTAREGLSELFTIDAELVHEESEAAFNPTVVDPKDLLGKGVTITVESTEGTVRDFSGMVNRFTQGNRDVRFSYYNISVVPHVWVLTQNIQSQIFQQISVPEILKKIFQGFDVKWELQGTFEPRNYCVQYRESDFAFASRLMEEEGIYYYFEHKEGKDLMIFGNTPQSHRDCPSKHEIPFFVKVGEQDDFVGSINSFLSGHNLQTGKVTLWDFNFQLPTKKLENSETSRFSLGDNQAYELYDYPGGYARKYDGIDKSGGTADSDLQKVFPDRESTVKNWMEALDAQVEVATGRSDVCSLTAGYRFQMKDHPNSDLNKLYTLTSVEHRGAQSPGYVSEDVREPYTNSFQCIVQGAGKPGFRPMRTTPKPVVQGGQTAMVVGPGGEEIYTDKYGRVKVQFPWDRDGQDDASSSCWVRVAQTWAGNKWGGMFIPRIGMEVLVHFLEGDPDQPIITGCVYNPQTMPPYTLPDEKTKSTLKSNSTKGGGGFNEFRFEDKKGKEQIFIHGQKDQDIRIRSNRRELIGNDRHLIVKRDKREKVERDKHVIIERDQIEEILRDKHRVVEGKIAYETSGSVSNKVAGSVAEAVGGNYALDVSGSYTVSANTIVLEATTGLTIKVGGNFVTINSAGVQINGTMVMINSGGAALPGTPGSPVDPLPPDEAEIADNADPGSDAPTYRNQRRATPPARVPSYTKPTHNPKSPKNKDKKSWIEIELKDELDNPVAGERYRVTLPDGSTIAEGTTDENGLARVTNIDPGSCQVTFPKLDDSSWDPK